MKHFKKFLQVLLSVKKLGIGQKVGNKGDRGVTTSLSLVFELCDLVERELVVIRLFPEELIKVIVRRYSNDFSLKW